VVVQGTPLTFGLTLVTLLACASPSFAAEPLPCTDTRVLHHLKQAYDVTTMVTKSGRQFHGAEEVRETGYGPTPAWVHQYAPAKDYYHKSRYCEARIRLDNGATDQAYFRLDGLKDSQATDFNFDPCFLSNDLSRDRCADQRPGR
jgi:hypothetical protein